MAAAFPIQIENQVVTCKSESDRLALALAAQIIRTGDAENRTADELAALRETCGEYGLRTMAQFLKPFEDRAHLHPRELR